ncbi:MAG: hypothetical protein V7K86_14130 [Nostoc sp.]|uniref:hypothetical protein n=1 Tax=Nostoc sp. TaxID=1180 RepID=UPI002FF7E26C
MTIPLFSGDARRNLLIRRGTDSYGEEGRRTFGERSVKPQDFGVSATFLRDTTRTTTISTSQSKAAHSTRCLIYFLEVSNKINNSVSLNVVNLQPALDEVFHAGS